MLILNLDDEKKTYNTDSFYEYPGFNSPVPNGFRDVILFVLFLAGNLLNMNPFTK